MWPCPGSSATTASSRPGRVFNVVYLSGLRPIQEFPWPPAEGWHPQATAFWTATGLIDTAIALLALYFVAAFFGGRRRALWAGLVSLDSTTYMSHHIRLVSARKPPFRAEICANSWHPERDFARTGHDGGA